MKKGIALCAVLAALAAGCEDPTLGQALDDVESAAPGVCRDFCNPKVDCSWQNLGEISGPESGAMLADFKSQCVLDCAFKAENGVFVYEYDWDETTGAPIYTVKEVLDGGIWADTLACLIDAGLWICADTNDDAEDENWVYEIDDGTTATCAAYNGCVALLEINLEFEWNPDANEGAGGCQASGDEFIWGDW
jgi:hypothetical protein